MAVASRLARATSSFLRHAVTRVELINGTQKAHVNDFVFYQLAFDDSRSNAIVWKRAVLQGQGGRAKLSVPFDIQYAASLYNRHAHTQLHSRKTSGENGCSIVITADEFGLPSLKKDLNGNPALAGYNGATIRNKYFVNGTDCCQVSVTGYKSGQPLVSRTLHYSNDVCRFSVAPALFVAWRTRLRLGDRFVPNCYANQTFRLDLLNERTNTLARFVSAVVKDGPLGNLELVYTVDGIRRVDSCLGRKSVV